ncbi:endonuclease/exonuclease/phosphatase family protein [bacterium SCSIO 12741]|nr:endonuclease/exonuclease/phosphatase family protein [bacterium SCSIO 12741]
MKTLDRVAYVLNYVFAIALVLSYISPYVRPGDLWFISLFGLLYPVWLAINIIFIIYWAFRLKNRFFLSILVIAAGYFHFNKFFQFQEQPEYPPVESIRFYSHNLKAFGLNGPEFQTEDGEKIFRYLDQHLFDVYCFQEFFDTDRKDFSPYDSIKKVTHAKYRHVEYLPEFRGNKFGLATLSQYPIVEKGMVEFEREGTNMCIYTDIDFDGTVVRVYNMHLQSVHLKPDDYEFLRNPQNSESPTEETKGLISRLVKAYEKREEQTYTIEEHMEQCPYPIIVCGDFNDTPLSHAYEMIRAGGNLKDAFQENGSGLGSTYNGMLPILRIDYMFYSPQIENHYFEIVHEDLSDHYPLIGYFSLPE